MTGYYILAGLVFLASTLVSQRLKSKFRKYSQTRLLNNMSGKEIAEKMLRDNGINDVEVIQVSGQLTDHYNPLKKTVNLSESVYHERNAAAAAVSAHECGHAVQHAQAYSFLQLRSKLVPAVNVASRFMQWLILGGLLMLGTGMGSTMLLVGIILFSVTTLFSFITLPVEFDASKRALAWMKGNNIVTSQEYTMSKDALKWAAMTYVVAALGSLATLGYYIMMFLGSRD